LADAGLFADGSGSSQYVGWRDGSFYVPVSLLKAGVNTVQFSDEDDASAAGAPTSPATTGSEPPLALKDIFLQLNYQAPQETGASQPQFLLEPPEPIPPASSSSTSAGTSAP